MKTVSVREEKRHLARLLEEAARGEEIVITRAGEPYVRLVACAPQEEPRVLGGGEGRVWIAPDFDETPEGLRVTLHGDP